MFRSRLGTVLICISFIVLLLAACSPNSSTSVDTNEDPNEKSQGGEKVLSVAIYGEPDSLDPAWAATYPDLAITMSIFNGLVRFPPGTVDVNNIEPDLAESWETNDDSTVWTFYLREGVQWHKGYGELTSEDVKWSFERIMDEETGSSWRNDFNNVISIETPDDYTVVFNLERADSAFLLKVVNFHGGLITNKQAIEDAGDNFKHSPVGTGPFVLESYKPQEGATLVKNEEYFRGVPKLDKIRVQVFRDQTAIDVAQDRGEIHLAAGVSDKLWVENREKSDKVVIDYRQPPTFYSMYMNTSKPPLDNILVRQAIAHAIDVETMVQSQLGDKLGAVPKGPIISGYFGSADVGIHEFDPEKSKQLLAEAGYENGLQLDPQFVSNTSNYMDKAVFVQEQLRAVGIEMPIEAVDNATMHSNIRDDMNQLIFYPYTRVPHVDVPLTEFFYGPSIVTKPTGALNFAHYDKVDDLIEKARYAPDTKTAMNLYREIQEKIKDDYVVVPLADTVSPLIRTSNVDLGPNGFKGSLTYFYQIDENYDIK
ncbi:ABC transporter substrate-binding protein [Bacillus dakarensis]|uniref:ABC transporter substrate-binding protein n=1 Tax=Robertmurraya dakarensis TaxID=1926278 RepID=UPI000981E95F|nr:ABC transporter substrate-binding protein [Bacillus dakarensis]